MEAWLVSLALVIALVVDAFVDPLLGNLSDRTYTRWGRRLPWLYAAPLPLAIAWYMLWSPPIDGPPSFWTLLGLAVTVRLLLSACEVPSVALVPEITRDYDERTTLFRYRFLFGWTGGLIALALAYQVFLRDSLLARDGYQDYGLFGAAVIFVFTVGSALAQHRYIAGLPEQRPPAFRFNTAFSEIVEAFSERAFLIFAAGALAAYVSQGMTFALSNYLYYFVWELSEGQLAIYPFVLFASVVAVFLALGAIHVRYGKARTAAASTLVSMTAWLLPYALRFAGLWPELGSSAGAAFLFVFIFVSNAAGVGALISATSMVAEIVEAFEAKTGRRAEASFYAGNWLVQKCATGVGILMAGGILSVVAFPVGSDPGAVAQPVLVNLMLIYCAAVAVFGVVSAYWLARFPIDRAQHEARLNALDEAARADPNAQGVLP